MRSKCGYMRLRLCEFWQNVMQIAISCKISSKSQSHQTEKLCLGPVTLLHNIMLRSPKISLFAYASAVMAPHSSWTVSSRIRTVGGVLLDTVSATTHCPETEQDRIGWSTTGQSRTVQDRTEKDKTMQDRTGQGKTEQSSSSSAYT